jgi:hypothetical protein
MATVDKPATHTPYLPPIAPDELRRRNAEAIRLLDEWERNGDEQEQREGMEVLLKALGPDRVMSYRDAFQ